MKLVFRGDDVGYTDTFNKGTFKAVDEGVMSHCDLMLDCPGFEDACAFLKARPWISVGWHKHFWGKPVLSPEEVPSMVNEEGRFKWRKDKSLLQEVDYYEALKECRAQLNRCIRLLGRVPDACKTNMNNPLERAITTACEEYHIPTNFMHDEFSAVPSVPDPKYESLNIYHIKSTDDPNTPSLKVEDFNSYDPISAILNIPINEDRIIIKSLHPGYLDDYILAESSCTIPRVRDVEAYCSPKVRQWVKDNNIELINVRDAIYGTSDFQNHLKAIGSDLVYKGENE